MEPNRDKNRKSPKKPDGERPKGGYITPLMIALTLVPAMAGKLLEHARPRAGGFQRVMPLYRKSVVWAVKILVT